MLTGEVCIENVEQILSRIEVELGETNTEFLRGILLKSCKSGRIGRSLVKKSWSLDEYVEHVVKMYKREQSYVASIRVEHDEDVLLRLREKLILSAFNILSKRGLLRRYAAELAEDYAHDAIEPILTAHYPYDSPFDAWAFSILNNQLGKRARESQRMLIEDKEAPFELIGDDRLLPEWELMLKQRDNVVMQAVSQLPPAQEQLVRLHYLEEQNWDAIALLMEKTIQQVYGLHRRAKDNLRQILGDFGIE